MPLDIYGVRYPETRSTLSGAGAHYRGWLPNARVPEVFARHIATVHVPRRFYVKALPGIPTIRVFEALACGIPLVSAPWEDRENLFRPGRDYLVAHDGAEMTRHLRALARDPELRQSLPPTAWRPSVRATPAPIASTNSWRSSPVSKAHVELEAVA